MIDDYKMWKELNHSASTRDYVKEKNLPLKYQLSFTAGTKKGWLGETAQKIIMKNAAESKYKHLKRPIGPSLPKFPAMEHALYREILARLVNLIPQIGV
jgi:hypothetical protein